MAVRLIYNHITHHARFSGYDQLAKYVDGEAFQSKGLPRRFAEKISWQRLKKMPYYASQWYGGPALRREIEICVRMLAPSKHLYHFLYAENDLRVSSLWKPKLNNRIVGSFHQPPEFLDRHVEDKRYIQGASAVVVMARSQISYLEQFLPADRIYHVPHGVDADYWCPDPALPRHDPPTFLVVGQWLRDIEMVTATIRILNQTDPDLRFHVVTFEEHAAQFRDCKNTYVMSGIPDEKLLDENRRATALFLPLKLATSNNAVLEAMACGTGVVSTDSGGTPEYVGSEAGVLVAPGDVDAAAETLRALARDPDRAAALGRAARQRIEQHYRWQTVGAQMNAAYKQILG